jgi:hypothetical protein
VTDRQPLKLEKPACHVQAIELDFDTKTLRTLSLEEAREAISKRRFVWIDLDARDDDEARQLLQSLGAISDGVVHDALTSEPATRHARYDEYIHVVVAGCKEQGTTWSSREAFWPPSIAARWRSWTRSSATTEPTSSASPKVPASSSTKFGIT